jgi:hypothetical protein
MKIQLPIQVTQKLARQALILRKHSPRIMFVGGIGGVITSTVLACRATLKLTDVVDTAEATIVGIRSDMKDTPGYRKDLAYAYGKTAAEVIKLYGPAVIVGGVSIAALTGSHVTLTRRNAAATAAYAAMAKSFDEYRDRVRHDLGDDRERELRHAVELVDIPDKNGKMKKSAVADPNKMSPYARFFDEYSSSWQKNPELNKIFLLAQQNYANHLLRARGHVFLNEIYDMLGLERCSAGQMVGWVISETGDNFIDFGMFEVRNADFVNNVERSILLDFNVDGVIYDKI